MVDLEHTESIPIRNKESVDCSFVMASPGCLESLGAMGTGGGGAESIPHSNLSSIVFLFFGQQKTEETSAL